MGQYRHRPFLQTRWALEWQYRPLEWGETGEERGETGDRRKGTVGKRRPDLIFDIQADFGSAYCNLEGMTSPAYNLDEPCI